MKKINLILPLAFILFSLGSCDFSDDSGSTTDTPATAKVCKCTKGSMQDNCKCGEKCKCTGDKEEQCKCKE